MCVFYVRNLQLWHISACTFGMLIGVRGRVLSVFMRWRWSAGNRWYFIASMRKSLQVLLFFIKASSSTIWNRDQISFKTKMHSRFFLSTQAFQSLKAFLNIITHLFIKPLCCCNTCLKCIAQQWQRHEHYRWEERGKKLRGKPVSCVWLKQKSVLLKYLHVGTLIVASWPTNMMTNVLHNNEQTVIYFNINSS